MAISFTKPIKPNIIISIIEKVTASHPKNIDFLFGCLLAFPIAYPRIPYYIIGLSIFLISIPRIKITPESTKLTLYLLAFISIGLITSIINPAKYPIPITSMFTYYGGFLLLLYGYSIKNPKDLLYGYSYMINLISIAIIIVYFILQPFESGLYMFTVSEQRMWGYKVFLEWPNSLCAFLAVGIGINFYLKRHWAWIALPLLSSLLTTSRGFFIIATLGALYLLTTANTKKDKILLITKLTLLLVLTIICIFQFDHVAERLLRLSDRLIILENIKSIIKDHWLFGIGAVKYTEIGNLFDSFHFTYLKILVRSGVIGLIIFIVCIFPKSLIRNIKHPINLSLLFLLISSIAQEFILHVHLLMLYSVLLIHANKITQQNNITLNEINTKKLVPAT